MSDVELVVKISEEDYMNIKNAINSLIENGVERASMSKVCLAILDGTPLPKGHGRLIDANKLLKNTQDYGEGQQRLNLIDPYYVKNAETVLTIPENPTNGDMIKAIFPNITLNNQYKGQFSKKKEFYFDNDLGNDSLMMVNDDWWNAPYKAESVEE